MSEPTRPEPLVPPDVDLRDFEFMPLLVRRLRDSRLIATKPAEEALAAIMLWSASWHQVPASSLPDDDRELAALAGYGRGVDAYLPLKTGSLYKCIRCSDGRWYHPVVAERAAEAWNAKLKEQHKRACDNQRKKNKELQERREPVLPMPRSPALLVCGQQSCGIPIWRYDNSTGNPAESKPPSDGSRGLRDSVRDRGSVRDGPEVSTSTEARTSSKDAAPQRRAPDPEPETVRRGVMCRCLRDEDVDVTPSNPLIVQWVREGLTVQTMREAVDVARRRKPKPERIPVAYLAPIVAELTATPGNGKHRGTGEWWESREGIQAKASELGISTAGADAMILRCRIAAQIGLGPWIDQRNATEMRVYREVTAA